MGRKHCYVLVFSVFIHQEKAGSNPRFCRKVCSDVWFLEPAFFVFIVSFCAVRQLILLRCTLLLRAHSLAKSLLR